MQTRHPFEPDRARSGPITATEYLPPAWMLQLEAPSARMLAYADRVDALRHRAFSRALELGADRDRAQFHWARWTRLDALACLAYRIGKGAERLELAERRALA